MPIKKSREEMELDRTIVMANYLIHLSQASNSALVGPTDVARVYECKTCNRKFPSFQALGGHRASHKKLKMSDHDHNMIIDQDRMNGNSRKPKSHECSICGLEFPVGQALGGHMRRHRTALNGSSHLPTLSLSLESYTSHDFDESKSSDGVNKIKGTSGHHHDHDHDHKSVTCLDLNLTPLENGLLEFGKIAPPFVY